MKRHTIDRRSFLQTSLMLGMTPFAGLGAGLDRSARPHRASQTVKEKVEQLFVVSFPGTVPNAVSLSLLQQHAFGGIILYGRNCHSPGQIQGLLTGLQRAARYPLLVAVDQEGGLVERIRAGVHTFPAEAVYGQTGSTTITSSDAATTAHDLRAVGINLNLAPVIDVLSNPTSPIGTRSYGSDPRLVARLSTAAIRGYQEHGMAAAAKHFIGLGHTSIDSHAALPTVHQSLAQLERNDLIPFRAAVAAGVSCVLVAHVALPKIDPLHRPASLSPVITGGLLRKRLKYGGVVMTDSLAMGAIPIGGTAEAAEKAIIAGADILLLASDKDIPAGAFEAAVERVVGAVRAGRITESRLAASLARIAALKSRYPPVIYR